MEDLIRNLDMHRLENKISQVRLGEMLGVSFSTVSRWFNGRAKPNKIQTYHIKKLLESKP